MSYGMLNQTEVLELLSVATIAQMHTELLAELNVSKSHKRSTRISQYLSMLEKAMHLKRAQITLIGNL